MIMNFSFGRTMDRIRYTVLCGALFAGFIQNYAPAIFGLPVHKPVPSMKTPAVTPASNQRPPSNPRRIVPIELLLRHASLGSAACSGAV